MCRWIEMRRDCKGNHNIVNGYLINYHALVCIARKLSLVFDVCVWNMPRNGAYGIIHLKEHAWRLVIHIFWCKSILHPIGVSLKVIVEGEWRSICKKRPSWVDPCHRYRILKTPTYNLINYIVPKLSYRLYPNYALAYLIDTYSKGLGG